jgi:hypothetical protein
VRVCSLVRSMIRSRRTHCFSAGVDVDPPTFTERLEDLCAALSYSGVDDKRERAGLLSQSYEWARGGMVPLHCHMYDNLSCYVRSSTVSLTFRPTRVM